MSCQNTEKYEKNIPFGILSGHTFPVSGMPPSGERLRKCRLNSHFCANFCAVLWFQSSFAQITLGGAPQAMSGILPGGGHLRRCRLNFHFCANFCAVLWFQSCFAQITPASAPQTVSGMPPGGGHLRKCRLNSHFCANFCAVLWFQSSFAQISKRPATKVTGLCNQLNIVFTLRVRSTQIVPAYNRSSQTEIFQLLLHFHGSDKTRRTP